MEAVKASSQLTSEDYTPMPQVGGGAVSALKELKSNEKYAKVEEWDEARKRSYGGLSTRDFDDELLNGKFTMEMFNSPMHENEILSAFRFTKSSFDLSRMSFLERRKR